MSLSQERALEQWVPVLAPGSVHSRRACLQYKVNTRFPLQTWHCCFYLITKWIYLLRREKASYRLFSQSSLCLPVLRLIPHMLLQSFFHGVWTFKCTRYLVLPHKPLAIQEKTLMEGTVYSGDLSLIYCIYQQLSIEWDLLLWAMSYVIVISEEFRLTKESDTKLNWS